MNTTNTNDSFNQLFASKIKLLNTTHHVNQTGGATVDKLSDIIGKIFNDNDKKFNYIDVKCELSNNDVLTIIHIEYTKLDVTPTNVNDHYNITIKYNNKEHKITNGKLDIEKSNPIKLILVNIDQINIKYNNNNIESPLDNTNCSEELIHYIISKLIVHDLASNALAIYDKSKTKIMHVTSSDNLPLKYGFNDYHSIQILPRESNVYGQCYIINNSVVHVMTKLKLTDSCIGMTYCNTNTKSGLANLVKALSISPLDRPYIETNQLFNLVFVKLLQHKNVLYNGCFAASGKTLGDLASKDAFLIKQETVCKEFKHIGRYFVDDSNIIYTCSANNYYYIAKKATTSYYTTIQGDSEVFNDNDGVIKLKLIEEENNKYYVSDDDKNIYFEESNDFIKSKLSNINIYVCTHNINPLKSDIKLIDLLLE